MSHSSDSRHNFDAVARGNLRADSDNSAMSHQAMLRGQAQPPAAVRSAPRVRAQSSPTGSHPVAAVAPAAASSPASNSRQSQQHQLRHQHAIPQNVMVTSDSESDMLDAAAQANKNSGWMEVQSNGGTPPCARSLHAAALLNGVMYIFGGYDGAQRVNTFHAFSFADRRWSPVLPSSVSASQPSPRDRHVSVAHGNSVYVHGGFDGKSRVNDFWRFDFSAMTWREVSVQSGTPPSPRHSHAAVVHGDSLYVFGGYDGSYKSDLHEFDFLQSTWSTVPAAGRRPRARYRATAVVHKNSLLLYGGHDGTRHLSDTHVFDFDTSTWSQLATDGPIPPPRDSHVSAMHGNSMYVFGGSSGSALNDLHELQLVTKDSNSGARWRQIKTAGADQPCQRFCHVASVHNESLYVFGGYDGSDRLNDFIRFDFSAHDMTFDVPQSTLMHDLRNMVDSETLSDITFMVGNIPVHGHKMMLLRCEYFRALFLGDMQESRTSVINIDQVSHPIFIKVLEYIYTDHVIIPFDMAMDLFQAADWFCIPRLKTMCEKRMFQSINVTNAASIFHAADMHSATSLRTKAKKYILSNFEAVSKTVAFEDMGRTNIELLFELLKCK